MTGSELPTDVLNTPPSADSDAWDGATKEQRMAVVVQFLADTGLALSPSAIHRNLVVKTGYTASHSTTQRYLRRLAERGLVQRVQRDPLADGKLVEPTDSSRAWYIAAPEAKRPYGMALLDGE